MPAGKLGGAASVVAAEPAGTAYGYRRGLLSISRRIRKTGPVSRADSYRLAGTNISRRL